MEAVSQMGSRFKVVDLFAGPGGLGEGFASLEVDGEYPFSIGISVEKEQSAWKTLRLRAFLREYSRKNRKLPYEFVAFHAGDRDEPNWKEVDAEAWKHACTEARLLELGSEEAASEIDLAIKRLKSEGDDTILIGGPPCQAYSLVGRARSRGKKDYVPEEDARHFLFREYIRVLDKLRPAIFVMENVKGMLSSTVQSRRVFEMVMEDLSSLGHEDEAVYELRAIRIEGDEIRLKAAGKPTDFIVRAEQFGVPQRRHRVIIVGVRSDLACRADDVSIPLPAPSRVTVSDAIGSMPPIRSGLSPAKLDDPDAWKGAVANAARKLSLVAKGSDDANLGGSLEKTSVQIRTKAPSERMSRILPKGYNASNSPLLQWLENRQLKALAQHDARGHMESDLGRYVFVSTFGQANARSPKAADFPAELAPDHKSWSTGKFADRFRVQLANEPATTITSHISKDGHYFIHPDPMQCRSLTVREAARLQTFPDDYFFLGNRTQQYVQVGNAVPPYLARQIAQLLLCLLGAGVSKSSVSEISKAKLFAS
jgi:DNA (cytosine-5)-methyltransferase 1